MREIKLTRNQTALVSDEDYDIVNQFKWQAIIGGNTWYACRSFRINGKKRMVQMHQFILGDNPLKLHIDHRDGNGLNNQRFNIRFCTRAQNNMNKSPQKHCRSQYKGVRWNDRNKKWQARISHDGILEGLGLFVVESDAATAYNNAALKYFGEFARLNIIIIKTAEQ